MHLLSSAWSGLHPTKGVGEGYLGIEFYLFVCHGGMNDSRSMCKFHNARSAFRNFHVDPLSFIPPWETNKKNSIFIFILYQNCPVLAMQYLFIIHNRAVFRTAIWTAGSYVTGTVSWKNGCQNFSYVHSSRKHWECKYTSINPIVLHHYRLHVWQFYITTRMTVDTSSPAVVALLCMIFALAFILLWFSWK